MSDADKKLDSLWKQVDPDYWSGPDGWSICKVIQEGEDCYELWGMAAKPVSAAPRRSKLRKKRIWCKFQKVEFNKYSRGRLRAAFLL